MNKIKSLIRKRSNSVTKTFEPNMRQLKSLPLISVKQFHDHTNSQIFLSWFQQHSYASTFINFRVIKKDPESYKEIQKLAFVSQSKQLFALVTKIAKKIQTVKSTTKILTVEKLQVPHPDLTSVTEYCDIWQSFIQTVEKSFALDRLLKDETIFYYRRLLSAIHDILTLLASSEIPANFVPIVLIANIETSLATFLSTQKSCLAIQNMKKVLEEDNTKRLNNMNSITDILKPKDTQAQNVKFRQVFQDFQKGIFQSLTIQDINNDRFRLFHVMDDINSKLEHQFIDYFMHPACYFRDLLLKLEKDKRESLFQKLYETIVITVEMQDKQMKYLLKLLFFQYIAPLVFPLDLNLTYTKQEYEQTFIEFQCYSNPLEILSFIKDHGLDFLHNNEESKKILEYVYNFSIILFSSQGYNDGSDQFSLTKEEFDTLNLIKTFLSHEAESN